MTATDDLRQAVKSAARQRLAEAGATDLSPDDLGEPGELPLADVQALFSDRDALLTELIMDAYNDSGAAMERADDAARAAGSGARMMAASRGLREWAADNPAEFTLLYGSPVPGYHAPQVTVGPASRTPAVIARILSAALDNDELQPPTRPVPGPPLIRQEAVELFGGVPDEPFSDLIERGIVFWSNLVGLLVFEVFSRTHDSVHDHAAFFDYAIAVAAESVGLTVDPENANR